MTTTAAPQLQQLARLMGGEPRIALTRLLRLSCELLGMDAAFVSVITPDGQRVMKLAVEADGTPVLAAEGRSDPLSETWCGRVVADGTLLVEDAAMEPALLALPVTDTFQIVSYAGVTLQDDDGEVLGTFCALGHHQHDSLNPRDRDVLLGLGEIVAPLLRRWIAPKVPRPRVVPEVPALARAVTGARSVEDITRPLLEALHELTGLASSYLTVVHEETGQQEIRFAHNTRPDFVLPEGESFPWADTLCKRALDEGRPCTTDVPAIWGDSASAMALGIQVYVSVPVEMADGRLWGTLCAADSMAASHDVDSHLPTMRLLARLIAAEVAREAAFDVERAGAAQARQEADTDPLTGCSSRRVVEPWLAASRLDLGPDEAVLVVYADVDGFKQVNDGFGHAAGDAVLVEVARRLRAAARPDDLVARLGGDEFLLAARLPGRIVATVIARVRKAVDFETVVDGHTLQVHLSIGSAVADAHDPIDLVAVADSAMYLEKRGLRPVPPELLRQPR